MRRTFAAFVPPLLAALALLSPEKAVAGPPEGASGKMVLDIRAASTRAKYNRIQVGMTEKEIDAIMRGWLPDGIGISGTGQSIVWSRWTGSDCGSIYVHFTPDGTLDDKKFSKRE
jgi:hypothetical protein